MRLRRRWIAFALAAALLALAIRWLLGPADRTGENDDPSVVSGTGGPPSLARHGRRSGRSRLDELVAWIRHQVEDLAEPDPPATPFEPTPSLGPPGSLKVTMREEGGPAIAGARVVVFGPPGAPVIPAGTTDADGRVAFPSLPSGRGYEAYVTVPATGSRGDGLAGHRIVVEAGRPTLLEIEQPSLRIEGVVRDAVTGESVAGADVEAFAVDDELHARARDARVVWTAMAFGGAESASRVGSTVSEPDGRFRLDVGAREGVELYARAADGRAGTRLVTRGMARFPTELSVRALRRCAGIVVDADGRPQPGLRISHAFSTLRSDDAPPATTDAEGRFSLAVAVGGTSARVVVQGSRAPRFSATVPTDRDARIVVPEHAVLDMRIVEDASGHPLAEAYLLASVGLATTEATTDADGRARVGTAGGPISIVRVFAPGYPEIDLGPDDQARTPAEPADAFQRPLAPRETRSVTVRARRGAVVVGRVLHPEGRPADQVGVGLTTGWSGPTPTARSGPDGRFEIVGCVAPPPSWSRGVRAHGDGGAAGTFEAQVPTDPATLARGTIDLGDVTLRRGAVVRAQVVDPDGKPIPAADVSGNVAARADAEGWLTMAVSADLLRSDGTLVFDVAASGFRTRAMRCSAALAPGVVRDLPPIRLERGPRVAARVIDAGGHPLAGCTVRWAWNGDTAPARTDAEGRAMLSGAPSQEEDVQVALPDGARFTRSGTLPPAQDDRIDLELRLPPTRTLVVRVVDSTGAPVEFASLSAAPTASPPGALRQEERWSSVDAAGLAYLRSVVAAPMRLRAHAPGFVTQEVTIDATTTSATVTLEAMGDASARRLAEVLASLERLEGEIRAQDPDDESEEAQARFRRQQELRAERERLRGR